MNASRWIWEILLSLVEIGTENIFLLQRAEFPKSLEIRDLENFGSESILAE